MKIQVISIFVLLLLLSSAPLIFAQANPVGVQSEQVQAIQVQAIQDAERDALVHHNRPMWFAIGCIFPGVGLLAPYFYQPLPPASAFIGKSPEYVAYYTDTYKRKTQNLQFQGAAIGCGTFGVFYAFVMVVAIAEEGF